MEKIFRILFYSCLVILWRGNFVICKNLISPTALQKQIISLKPYQVTVFRRNNVSVHTTNFIINLATNMSAVIVDLPNILNQSLLAPVIKLPRESNLLEFLQDKLDLEDVQSSLENFIGLSPIKIRPRCLVIFNDTHDNYESIRSVLLFGLSRKFLDFNVVNLSSGEIFNYDPFFKVLNHHQIISADVFPDKLKNMNKYPVRIPFLTLKPYLYKTEANNITEYHGINAEIFKFLESALNFKISYFHDENFLNSPIKASESLKFDLLPGHLSLSLKLYTKLEIGKVVSYHELRAVTPYSNSFQLQLSIIKLLFLVSNIIFAFFIAIFAHYI